MSFQCALEFALPDVHYANNSKRVVLFAHGGVLYWLISAAVLTLVSFFLLLRVRVLEQGYCVLLDRGELEVFGRLPGTQSARTSHLQGHWIFAK